MSTLDAEPNATFSTNNVLLDLFVPGFTTTSVAIQKYFHVDLNTYIPAIMLLGAIIWVWGYIQEYFWQIINDHLTCTVDIKDNDEVYKYLMTWVAKQKFARSSKRFLANTNVASRSTIHFRDHDSDDDDNEPMLDLSAEGRDKKLNYTPSIGTHHFWYENQLCFFQRIEHRNFQTSETISVGSYGRSTLVLKSLLEECRRSYIRSDEQKTIIYRGSTRHYDPSWVRCLSRPSRSFSTVILEEGVKKALIEDMADYLQPETRRWYMKRGIPYRRGYLLYGPPGTGKSSLSFAIAGYFKLKIHIISLGSNKVSEDTISTLFADLPRQCIVLLEDIDAAGMTDRRSKNFEEGRLVDEFTGTTEAGQVAVTQTDAFDDSEKLSLSSLLNVIDGVASQEGRILIMTTNHLEQLDPALIRPGRVDMRIQFKLADAYLMRTIFKDIFLITEADKLQRNEQREPSADSIQNKESACRVGVDSEIDSAKAEAKKVAEEQKIAALADRFATILPENEFSPAAIQGFLLNHKRHPEKAVESAGAWVKEMTKERNAKTEKAAREKNRQEKLKTLAELGKVEKAIEEKGGVIDETTRLKRTEASMKLLRIQEEKLRETLQDLESRSLTNGP